MKKKLLDDIVAHIAESVVHRFVAGRKGKDGSEQQERGRKPVSIEVNISLTFVSTSKCEGAGRLPAGRAGGPSGRSKL